MMACSGPVLAKASRERRAWRVVFGQGVWANPLISCAETWPAKTVHGSVGLSLQLVHLTGASSKQP